MAGPIALPDRLPAVSDRWLALLRPLWLLLFAFAVIADVGGVAYILHDTYENDPVFADLGLSSDVDYDGTLALGPPVGRESASQGIREGSRILAVNGSPLPPKAGVERVASRLREAPGPVVRVRIQDPSGRVADHDLTRSPVHAREASRGEMVSRDARMIIRLISSTTACLTLLLCAVTLFIRRPEDPVALLFSFAFIGMAATIDPPLMMWMALGLSESQRRAVERLVAAAGRRSGGLSGRPLHPVAGCAGRCSSPRLCPSSSRSTPSIRTSRWRSACSSRSLCC